MTERELVTGFMLFISSGITDANIRGSETFLLAGVDLTGVGWADNGSVVTAITPHHVVMSGHNALRPGWKCHFRVGTEVFTRTAGSLDRLTPHDFAVVTLTEPLPDSVHSVRLLDPTEPVSGVYVFGNLPGRRDGRLVAEQTLRGSILIDRGVRGETGDSGSPVVVRHGNFISLVGVFRTSSSVQLIAPLVGELPLGVEMFKPCDADVDHDGRASTPADVEAILNQSDTIFDLFDLLSRLDKECQ